ncbi:MAG: hypothetical protein ACN4GF_04265 [Lentimonas sp.]
MSPVLLGVLLAGVLVHLAGFLIFKVESNPLPTRDENSAFVRYVSANSLAGDRALEEQAQLFDSAPLFVPTQWNAAQNVSLMPSDRVGERFPEFEPEINLIAALHSSNLPMGTENLVEAPGDLLASRFWSFFERFAQAEETIEPFPTVGHFAEVVVVGRGEAALSMESPLQFTDTSAVPEPVQLFLRLSGGGQALGEPVVSQSSGNPVFDRAAQDWLRKSETVGQLPRGYLWITVYP